MHKAVGAVDENPSGGVSAAADLAAAVAGSVRNRCSRRPRWRGAAAARTLCCGTKSVPAAVSRRDSAAFRGQAVVQLAEQTSNPGGCAVASRSATSSCGVGSAPHPDIGNGRGCRGTRAPEPPPRPGYTSRPRSGSGTASRAAVTAGKCRKRSRFSSDENSISSVTPQRWTCHVHCSAPLVSAASVSRSP